MEMISPTLELTEKPDAGEIVSNVLAAYCLAGRKAAAPPMTTHSTNAARATTKLCRTSLMSCRISMVSNHLVMAHGLVVTHGGGAAPS